MAGETWAPTLADVARHIPRRTRDTLTPGSDTLLGTFTSTTTPTDEQAQAVIDDAVQSVIAQAGAPASSLPPTDDVMIAARSAAEWRAAADIELAYPNRDADVRLFTQLDQRAKDALAFYRSALQGEGLGQVDLVPYWQAPDPPPWADRNFDIDSVRSY